MSFIKEFWEFFKSKKEVLASTNNYNSCFIWRFNSLTQGSAIAPFIYTIF